MLQVNHLAAARGDRLLFKNLSFTVNEGELLLIKGRNGTGKTSLIRLISGLAAPEAGDIRWQGQSILDIRAAYLRLLIYVGHENGLSLDLTVEENLAFHRSLKARPTRLGVEEILRKLGIAGYLNVPCRFLSAGQKRRVALARLSISDCKLWLLDEPFSWLDGQASDVVTDLIIWHLQHGGLCLTTCHQTIDWQDAIVAEIQLDAVE